MSDIKSVLLVCTGNSCRSVMAEGLLKKYLKESGKAGIEVTSAGTRAIGGLPPTDETVEVMKSEGVDISRARSKNLTDDLIKKSDLILVMEDMHKSEIARRVPESASKTHLVKEYGLDGKVDHIEGVNIPDPIGRPMEFYKYTIKIIKNQMQRIAKLL